MKDGLDEFSIPEYWLLEIDNDNREIVNNWRINILKYDHTTCPYSHITENGGGWVEDAESAIKGGRVKINTFQFKKYILKIIEDLPIVKEEESLEYLVELFERMKIK